MQVRLLTFVQNMLTLQTLLLSKLENVSGHGTVSCLRENGFGHGHTRVRFLREEDAGLLLYTTLWSEDLRLQTCEIHTDPLAIANYSAYCKRSNEDDELSQRFDLNALLSPHAPCMKTDAVNGDHGATGEGKLRRKRSWIFPGTLWCGTGSKAFGFDELGMFEGADRCCREHDHCHHIIPAFTVNYGVFNPNFYTVSHCDCDQRFRQCLLEVNDTISTMVLYSFFNVLKVPCFELKVQKRCTKLYWWGMCKAIQEAPYAIFKRPFNYNISLASQSEKSDSSKSTLSKVPPGVQDLNPPRKKPRPVEKCISMDKPRGDTFFRVKTNGCRRNTGEESSVDPHLHNTSLKTYISSKTKGRKRLPANPYVKATSTTPTTVPPTKSSDASQFTRATTTSQRVKGHQLSTENAFQSLKKKKQSPLTTTSPAVSPIKGLHFTLPLTPSVYYYDNMTIADPFTHYLDSKTPSQVHAPFPGRATNQLTNSGDNDSKLNKSLINNKTGLCECLKHLYECRYKIPPLKKRFGLKNLDTKPAYHCTCTKRLAKEIQSMKSSAPSFLVDLVSQNCFKLPKRKKCRHRKSCSGGFSKASDLLQALKTIEKNGIAGVRNSSKPRKGRISVQLYKRCLRLRKEAMALLT